MYTYPGSNRKVKDYSNYQPQVEDQSLSLPPLPDLGKPKHYMVGTQVVPLYRIGALAKALNRKPVTVRKWEDQGVIPNPPMLAASHDVRGKRRLYTLEQIEELRRIAHEEGILSPGDGGKWKDISKTNFASKAATAFRQTT